MNNRWNELSLREKRDLMRVFIKEGVTDLSVMKKEYNSFGDGGEIDSPGIFDFLKKRKKVDFSGIKTTGDRPYNPEYIQYMNEKLDTIPANRRAVILGNIIEESGGNPFAKSKGGTYQGLLQWGADRYRVPDNETDPYKLIDSQLQYIVNSTKDTTNNVNWTHGGKGSGYNSYKEPYKAYWDKDNSLEDMHRAFSWGYVRPKGKGKSEENRGKVVGQIYNIIK